MAPNTWYVERLDADGLVKSLITSSVQGTGGSAFKFCSIITSLFPSQVDCKCTMNVSVQWFQLTHDLLTCSNTLRANAATSELMNVLVAPAVRFMLEGSNCNILSFGAQGSGKTAALFGTEDGMEGFIELVVKHLLSTVSTDSNSHIGMSMWEIRRVSLSFLSAT
jgi:hypothetical protein